MRISDWSSDVCSSDLHMQEQGRLGRSSGIPKVVVQKNGDIVRLAPGEPGKLAEVRAGRLLLDGDIIAPADGDAITMRRRIARDGAMIVVLGRRSEEHTSELQSLMRNSYAVFCLKKKK